MATISSAGVGSGLNVESIITQLMTIEKQPLTKLQAEEKELTTSLSNVGKLQGLVSTMRDKAVAMNSLTLWGRTTATSGDASAVAVTSGSGAATGVHSVAVQQLAAGQTVSSRRFTQADPAAFAGGTLTIELGSYTGSPTVTGFTPKDGASAVTITLTDQDDTLAEVRDKINAANAGVVATVITDSSGSRLAIRSKDSGAENGFRITATETNDDGLANNGLSALAFDAQAASTMTLNQRASNALATIDGIQVESASNTLAGVTDGLTLKLNKVTAAPVDVTVNADTDSVKTALQDFVSAYNALATYISDQTKYDAATKKAGAMQGDSMVLGIQRQMRNLLSQASSASGVFGRLSDVGITLQRDGTLAVDSGKLDNGLANLPELRKLLSTDGTDAAGTGFMRRFSELGDLLLGTDGAFDTRNDTLQARVDRNEQRQEQMQARLDATEKRLRDQYTALDKTMGQLSGLSSAVSQQMAALNNFYTARANG